MLSTLLSSLAMSGNFSWSFLVRSMSFSLMEAAFSVSPLIFSASPMILNFPCFASSNHFNFFWFRTVLRRLSSLCVRISSISWRRLPSVSYTLWSWLSS